MNDLVCAPGQGPTAMGLSPPPLMVALKAAARFLCLSEGLGLFLDPVMHFVS